LASDAFTGLVFTETGGTVATLVCGLVAFAILPSAVETGTCLLNAQTVVIPLKAVQAVRAEPTFTVLVLGRASRSLLRIAGEKGNIQSSIEGTRIHRDIESRDVVASTVYDFVLPQVRDGRTGRRKHDPPHSNKKQKRGRNAMMAREDVQSSESVALLGGSRQGRRADQQSKDSVNTQSE
jgi:hypothetical protein